MYKYNLNELEVKKIEQFCKDEEMLNAVKKVLLAAIYQHGTIQQGYTVDPLQNGAFSLAAVAVSNPIPDEVLGQHIRGMWAGVNAMQNAINDLNSIKSKGAEVIESPYNEAE